MRRYKNVLLAMMVWAGMGHWGITNAFGSNVILEFNEDGVLPSSQGLTYQVGGLPNPPAPPETSLFSVSGGRLHMNTIGLGSSAWYQLSNAYDPAQDFVLEFRMKVLQADSFGYGIDFEVSDASYDYEFGFGSAGIILAFPNVFFYFNTTDDFHTYKIVATASSAVNKTYEFFIDDILRHTGTISPGQNPSQRFLFGDGTFATDGKADIDFIRFCQPACPIPDSDGDGVGDASDLCPGTGPGEAVNSNGCSIAQLSPCNADWRNHGEYVSSLAHTAEEFLETGLITEEEKDAVIAEGARSGCGK
jgi:hypothetical protein